MNEEKKILDMNDIRYYQVAMRRVIALARSDYQEGHYLGTMTSMPPLIKSDRRRDDILELIRVVSPRFDQGATLSLVYHNVLVTMWHNEKEEKK